MLEKSLQTEIRGFFPSLFEHLPPGFIEIRMIEDRKGGRLLDRRWYPKAEDLISVLPELNLFAESHNAGIFFGVLPRRNEGVGKSEDALSGYAAWIDLDYRDYEGGEKQCLKLLGEFILKPSTVVRSGHGVHCYYFFKEPEEPRVLVEISARLAKALHGDHVADAARVMRLPGTMNFKDPTNPVPVVIEALDLDCRYNLMDFDEVLPPLPEPIAVPKLSQIKNCPEGCIIDGELSERVRKLIDADLSIQNLFNGRGKPDTGEKGERLDTTSSGYDFSFVLALAKNGLCDEVELATALWNRPDGAARSKGVDYILYTVRKAIAATASAHEKSPGQGGAVSSTEDDLDFVVEKVRIFSSQPAVYELTVNGTPIRFTTQEIVSKSRFRARTLDALHFIPELPQKDPEWHQLVNTWMKQAEIVHQPPEASEGGLLKERILTAIKNLAIGESVSDLEYRKGFQMNGGVIFKTITLLEILKESHGEVRTHVLCSYLHELGFISKVFRIDKEVVRAWTKAQSIQAPDADGEVEDVTVT